MMELYSHRVYGAHHFVKVYYDPHTHSHTVHWKDGEDENTIIVPDDRMMVVTPTNPYHPDVFEGIFIHLHHPHKRKVWIGVCGDIVDFRKRNCKYLTDESDIPFEEA